MIEKRSVALLALISVGIGGAALAQQMAPGPTEGPPAAQQQAITAERAIEIAREHGLVELREVERDDDKWEVEGRDAEGREIEIEINLRTGKIVGIERG